MATSGASGPGPGPASGGPAGRALNGRSPRSGPGAYLLEAVLAVDRPSLGGQEGDLGVGPADGALDGVHRPRAGHGPAFAAQGPALGAAAGLVQEPLQLVELLLARREGELDSAVATGEGFVSEAHPGTSFRSLLRLEIGSLAGVPAAWWLADPREDAASINAKRPGAWRARPLACTFNRMVL